MHRATAERVGLDSLDGQALQIEQTRGVRGVTANNILRMRRLNQACDLTSMIRTASTQS
jgi:hypothetical protein